MPRILVAGRAVTASDHRHVQWIEVDDAAGVRQTIATMLRSASSDGRLAPRAVDAQEWSVLAYEGLPDFGPHPDLDELLVYLDVADDYGEPFEKFWASRRFGSVLQAADVFADTYQGTYADVGAWARHYLALIGDMAQAGPGFDFDAYGREAAAKGDVKFIAATDGGLHAFWND